MGTGMVLAHSLLPAPVSLCVSLASSFSPRSTARRACSPHSTGGYRNTQVLLWGFIVTLVSTLRDEPVPGVLQQCHACTGATEMVIRLCKMVTLAKCNFTPEHLLEL